MAGRPRCHRVHPFPASGTAGRRRGLTLVELLVVVVIVAALVGLILPAVQMARETARRTLCQNNMRQLGIAMQGFESANGFFAPANSTGADAMWPPNNPKEHGMFGMILPYVEEGSLFTSLGYDFQQDWDAAVNRAAARTIIPTFVCGSAPDGPRTVTKARYPTNTYASSWGASGPACNDYAVITEVQSALYVNSGTTSPANVRQREGLLPTNKRTMAAHVRDGLSTTLALVECGNRPLRYFNGRVMGVRSSTFDTNCDANNDSAKAAWADNRATFPLGGAISATGVPNGECYTTDATGRVPSSGSASGGSCVMNCTNWDEPYSFHPDGMNVAFGDGSVRFLTASIAPFTMISLVTRDGREIVGEY